MAAACLPHAVTVVQLAAVTTTGAWLMWRIQMKGFAVTCIVETQVDRGDKSLGAWPVRLGEMRWN